MLSRFCLVSKLIAGACLVLSVSSSRADTIAQPMDACPTPHHSCVAACGTKCTYWTCEDNTTIPIAINKLPMTFIRAKAQCTERLEEVVLNQLPLPRSQQQRMVDQVTHLPMAFAANSYACVSHEQVGPACEWKTGIWSGCTASCGYQEETRTITCSGGDDSRCDASTKPATSRSCNLPVCQWQPTGWTECSASCGPGTQTRTWTCSAGAGQCPGAPPLETQACNRGYCSWYADPNWGDCSAKACGTTGTQTRLVSCQGPAGSCNPVTQPASSQACSAAACAVGTCTALEYFVNGGTDAYFNGGLYIDIFSYTPRNVTLAEGQVLKAFQSATYEVPIDMAGVLAPDSYATNFTCSGGRFIPQCRGWVMGSGSWVMTDVECPKHDKALLIQETCHRGCWGSPLMIHLEASAERVEPLVFTSQLDGINFDLMGLNAKPTPHTPYRISWYRQPKYYFIVLPNAQGEVNGIDELFGNNTAGPDGKFAQDGYWALAKYDGTTADGLTKLGEPDGFITKEDAVFAKLRYWHDADFDGKAQPEELRTAAELGIELIDLKADENFRETDQYGNQTTLKSVVRTRDGRYHVMFDIWFAYWELEHFEKMKAREKNGGRR